MIAFYICAFILCTDVVYGQYQMVSQGWLAPHKVALTWDEAYHQCQLEGAVLASPITPELPNEIQTIIGVSSPPYFIGTRAKYVKNIYASVEGVPLQNMPVLDLIEKINPEKGQCLGMDSDGIHVMDCTSQLPYLCYKKTTEDMVITDCGTYDKDYKLVKSSGSCYKIHYNLTLWGDAYATCIAEGGNLAVINDHAEAQMIIKDIVTVKTHYVLVGLEDWKGNDEWRSLRGDPVEEIYNDWVSDDKPSTVPRCGTIDPDTAELKAFGNCLNTKFYFLCEKDPANIRFPSLQNLEPRFES